MPTVKRKKLLLVSMSSIMGGGEIYCVRLAKLLVVSFEIRALVRNHELASRLRALGICVSCKTEPAGGAGAYLSASLQLIAALLHDRPALVQFNGQHETYLALFARLLRVPYCVSRVNPLDTPPLRPRIKVPFLLSLLSRAQRVICVSRNIYDELAPLVPTARLVHIPTWAESAKPPRPSAPSNGPLQILFLGRLIEEKGLQDVLSSLPGIDGVSLTAVGEGPQLEAFRALATGLDVQFHAFSRDLAPFFERADVVVFPSREGYEGLPQAPLDAMAAGVPLLASNIVAVREIIGDTPGFLTFQPGDVADLRAKILYLRDHREALVALSRLGVERIASSFTEEVVGPRYLEIFEAAAAS